MLKQLKLYSTSQCHLCDLAQSLLQQFSHTTVLEIIDIAQEEALLDKYSLKIPVLQRQDTMAELNWPFNSNDIIEFLN